MRYLAAYLLALLANKEPTAETITTILKESDVSVDDAKLQSLLNKFEGKSVDEVLEEGRKQLATVSVGVASSASVSVGGGSTQAAEETAAPVEDEPEVCF